MATVHLLGLRDHGRPVTREEFETAQWEAGYHYELIHGKLYVSPLPNLPQNWIEMWLLGKLLAYAGQHPEVINYVTPKARVLVPNVADVTQPEPSVDGLHDLASHFTVEQMDGRVLGPGTMGAVLLEDE